MWHGRLCAGLLVAGLLAVVLLWADAAYPADLAGPGVVLSALGRLSGLTSGYLMLVQVVLIARVPLLEQCYGQDRLALAHRLVGFASFWLLLLHLVLIVGGYAVSTGTGLLDQTWTMIRDYPGMVLATVATGCIVLVVVTSIRSARRRLRYESWHLLHLYAYLGIGLALPHELWNGRDLLTSRAATVFWWAGYAVAAGSLLIWRVGVPIATSLRHDLRVQNVSWAARDVVSVVVSGRDLDRLQARAGQFFVWRFLSGPGWTRGHPYSLSALPDGRSLRITVKALGEDSALLTSLLPGTRVLVEGPYGRMHGGTRSQDRVTLLAAGIGITPLRAVMEDLCDRARVTLIYRARDEGDIVLRQEIDAFAARHGVDVHYLLGPRRPGASSMLPAGTGRVPDVQALLHLVPDLAHHDVYLCGAPAWMDAAKKAVRAAGVPHRRIHEETFTW